MYIATSGKDRIRAMLKVFQRWMSPPPEMGVAHTIYDQVVGAARQPVFYQSCGVPDDLDGRFEMITLHEHLVLRRLRREGPRHADLAQAVFDVMFTDMDRSLRLMGVSDISIGKRVKTMVKAFYGRVAAYDGGLDAGDNGALLHEALDRNLFGTTGGGGAATALIAAYLRDCDRLLEGHSGAELAAGRLVWAPAPVTA